MQSPRGCQLLAATQPSKGRAGCRGQRVSSGEGSLDWGPELSEPPDAPSSWAPRPSPKGRWEEGPSPPPLPPHSLLPLGLWHTFSVSLAGSPQSWGAGTWETHGAPCTPPRRRLEAEPSPPPGPWQTSCASCGESPLGSPAAAGWGSPMAPGSSPTTPTHPPQWPGSRLERPVLAQTSWLDSLPFALSPARTLASCPGLPCSFDFPLGCSQGVPTPPAEGFFLPRPGQGSGPPEPGSSRSRQGARQYGTPPRHSGPPATRPGCSHPCPSACYCRALALRRGTLSHQISAALRHSARPRGPGAPGPQEEGAPGGLAGTAAEDADLPGPLPPPAASQLQVHRLHIAAGLFSPPASRAHPAGAGRGGLFVASTPSPLKPSAGSPALPPSRRLSASQASLVELRGTMCLNRKRRRAHGCSLAGAPPHSPTLGSPQNDHGAAGGWRWDTGALNQP